MRQLTVGEFLETVDVQCEVRVVRYDEKNNVRIQIFNSADYNDKEIEYIYAEGDVLYVGVWEDVV